MHFRIGRHRVDEIIDRMDERMLVTDHMPRRPPRSKIWVRRIGAHDRLEPRLVRRIPPIAIFQLVHPLETKPERPFRTVDFPTVIILVSGRQPRRFKSPVSAFDYPRAVKFG